MSTYPNSPKIVKGGIVLIDAKNYKVATNDKYITN